MKWCNYHNDYFLLDHFRKRNHGRNVTYDECREMANVRDRAKRRIERIRDKGVIDNPLQQILCCKW